MTKKQWQILTLMTISVLTVIGINTEVMGAEDVVIRCGSFRMGISHKDIVTFAETGKKSGNLEIYFNATKQDPKIMQRVLKQNIPVDGVMLSKVLNHSWSSFLLNPLAEVITTPSDSASMQSLRGALVLSALNDNQLSILEIIENYPTAEVHLQGDKILETYQTLENIMGSIGKWGKEEK
ncbi:MAG: alpha/beta hydrolase [Cyanobacterium sp. T60_A2020_053]|nr:alpha/beta hydrolase [Cyanobacterium sp. T60_A2020_053]